MNEAGEGAREQVPRGTRKKRRSRRRKQSAQARPPVQAEEKHASSPPESGRNDARAGDTATQKVDGQSGLPTRQRRTKRARRRGGKRKGSVTTNTAQNPQSATQHETPSRGSQSNEPHVFSTAKNHLSNKRLRHRATKRPGRGDSKDQLLTVQEPAVAPPSGQKGGDLGRDDRTGGRGQQTGPRARPRHNPGKGRNNGSAKTHHAGKHIHPKGGQHKASHRSDAYAALDLGTNNCRLLVAVPQQPGRFRVVDAFSRIVRLGEGLAASGKLSDAAMDRAVGALKACADKLEGRPVRGVRLIATEACRRATNGAAFLERVEREAGLKLEIIDRETEAHLAVAGCSSLVDRRASGVVLFDIGGGSSELALLDLSKRRRHDLAPAVVSWTSLPLGVVTLSEKHGGGRKVTRPVFEGMVAEVAALLENFDGRDSLQAAAKRGEIHLLGTSGTVTTLAGIHLKLPRYDRRLVDGTWMRSSDVTEMIDQLVDMTFEERVANPCIGRDRADLVLAGCAILVAIQKLWPCPRLRVADRGLREGLLTQMMNRDNAWQKRQPYRR
ncbi:MAG: Ppx/GppA phosphatase family protein [Pseudomonadota bacterium]